MAKKIEVFKHEYEYLTQFHKEGTLELVALRAERDKLKQELDELKKQYAELSYRADCYGCKNAVEVEEANVCQSVDFDCNRCTAEYPCCNCVAGSHYEFGKTGKEN